VADVVDGLIVQQEGAVSVLKEGVGAENRVIWLDNGSGNLRRGINAEVKLGFLTIINREALEEERAESGSSTTTDRVEDHKSLEAIALISEATDAIKNGFQLLLADGVVATGVVVSGVLLAGDKLVGMEELLVRAGADLVNDRGLKISQNGTRNILSSSSLLEKGLERFVVGVAVLHGTVLIDTVLHAVELPACISELDTSLTDVK